MIYIAAAQLVVIAGLVWVIRAERRSAAELLDRVLVRHEEQMHTMANRIQRPELVPVSLHAAPPGGEPRAPKDLGEIAKIGTISHQRPMKGFDPAA